MRTSSAKIPEPIQGESVYVGYCQIAQRFLQEPRPLYPAAEVILTAGDHTPASYSGKVLPNIEQGVLHGRVE